MNKTPSYYHVTWNNYPRYTTYYVEGERGNDGAILANYFQAISEIHDGKRLIFKKRPTVYAGRFPNTCKFRKLKKNPFNS